MKRLSVMMLGSLAFALIFWGTMAADAQWRSSTHDVYEALTGVNITIDGDVSDWSGVLESVIGTDGTPFTGVLFQSNAGDEVAFEELGGAWSGPDDHETSIMMVWEPGAFYMGLVVTDDEHEHAAAAAWNGDGVQLAFEMTGERPVAGNEALLLYNFALGDDGNLQIHYEKTLGVDAVDIAIVRDEAGKMTYYETKFSADELGVAAFEAGMEFGLGITVNDGDLDSPGQTGWSGWYPASIVFGKNAEKTGLVRLSSGTRTAVEPTGKLATTWADIKKR